MKQQPWQQRWRYYGQLMRVEKPIGNFLLLWPTLWGLLLANHGAPSWRLLIIFVCGVCLMRAAGCVINDFADRRVDGLVARTRKRPLAMGRLTLWEVWLIFGLLILFAASLLIWLNLLTFYLALVGLALTMIYPFAKRVTHFPQYVLGVAFAWSVILAFSASQNRVPSEAWLLFAAVFFWTVMFDSQYAMEDVSDDRVVGVKSTAVKFSQYMAIWLLLLQGLTLASLALTGYWFQVSAVFYGMLVCSAGFFLYQFYLANSRYLWAFSNNQWFGAWITLAFYLSLPSLGW